MSGGWGGWTRVGGGVVEAVAAVRFSGVGGVGRGLGVAGQSRIGTAGMGAADGFDG